MHGRVWLCEDTETNQFYAIKCVNRENRKQRSLRRSQAQAETTRRKLGNSFSTATPEARLHDEFMSELNPPHSPTSPSRPENRDSTTSFDEDMQLVPSAEEREMMMMMAARKKSAMRKRPIVMDEKVRQEIAIMKRSHHPNVVQLREVIDDQRSKKIFMGEA